MWFQTFKFQVYGSCEKLGKYMAHQLLLLDFSTFSCSAQEDVTVIFTAVMQAAVVRVSIKNITFLQHLD